MKKCKFCSSSELIKNGKPKGVQRYVCKGCEREQVEGDKRVKYENRLKRCAVILYLEGNGMRAIARILSEIFEIRIYFQTVAKWLKQAGEIVEKEVKAMPAIKKTIEIVEMDELFTYIQKNKNRSEYGLLLIGMNSVYLNLKLGVGKRTPG